jgi:hypothetical protein
MTRFASPLDAALNAVDEANRQDPNHITVDGVTWPLAELQGGRATHWVGELAADASSAVLLAARAHHLRRWSVARADFPDGRAGYHRWKRAVKEVHAQALVEVTDGLGLDPEVVARAQSLVRRVGLGSDPETQLIEDAACLVFLETQFEPLIDKIGRVKVVDAVRKTITKMSPAAISLAGRAIHSDLGREVLLEAAAPTEAAPTGTP